eukprot:5738907-Pyramimonas_sp.AAC.1
MPIPIPRYQYQYQDTNTNTKIPIPIPRYQYQDTNTKIIPTNINTNTNAKIPIPIPRYQYQYQDITSFYGSSCANNCKDALNTPGQYQYHVRHLTSLLSLCVGGPVCYHSQLSYEELTEAMLECKSMGQTLADKSSKTVKELFDRMAKVLRQRCAERSRRAPHSAHIQTAINSNKQ